MEVGFLGFPLRSAIESGMMLTKSFRFSWVLALCLSCVSSPSRAQRALDSIQPEELPAPEQAADSTAVDGETAATHIDPPPSPIPLSSAESDAAGIDEPYDVLLQGPIHEAFGVPTDERLPVQETVAPVAPPETINEQTPATKPAGKNIQWINGYWAWDEQRDGFIWISGMFREVPPGRSWVPGYWSETSAGFVWTSGYWAGTGLPEVTYLPEPPAPLSTGPSTPPPNANSFWLPGQWLYQNGSYEWQSGFWTQQYADWIWQPACYVHTPNGFVYVSGYWDYEPMVRGMPYAPLFFHSNVYSHPTYSYHPIYPIARSASLLLHLFVRSGYRCYYYGDYYGSQYASLGFSPWYRVARPSYTTASLLGYYDWKYGRSGISFTNSMLRYNDFFLSQPSARPIPKLTTASTTHKSSRQNLPDSPFGNSFDSIVRSTVGGRPVPRINSNNPSKGQRSSGLPPQFDSDVSRNALSGSRGSSLGHSDFGRSSIRVPDTGLRHSIDEIQSGITRNLPPTDLRRPPDASDLLGTDISGRQFSNRSHYSNRGLREPSDLESRSGLSLGTNRIPGSSYGSHPSTMLPSTQFPPIGTDAFPIFPTLVVPGTGVPNPHHPSMSLPGAQLPGNSPRSRSMPQRSLSPMDGRSSTGWIPGGDSPAGSHLPRMSEPSTAGHSRSGSSMGGPAMSGHSSTPPSFGGGRSASAGGGFSGGGRRGK